MRFDDMLCAYCIWVLRVAYVNASKCVRVRVRVRARACMRECSDLWLCLYDNADVILVLRQARVSCCRVSLVA